MAEALTKSSLSYTVDRVWFDSDYIYIVYEKKHVTSHYSMSDIHGTVLKEKSEIFLSRLLREVGEGSKVYNLENAEEATSIIYRDKEFDISSVGDGVRFAGRNNSMTLQRCKEPIWTKQGAFRQDVIRVRDRLLFCGVLFEQSGEPLLKIPKSIARMIESDYQENHFPLDQLVALSAISNDNLIIVRPDPSSHIVELKIGVWPLFSDKEMKWVIRGLPTSQGGYEVDTYRAYSPESFVLRPAADEDKSILLCNEARCERINLHDKYSIVIVDEEKRNLIEIISGTMMANPSVIVHTSNY
jgi:hypothetical protein